MLNTTEGGTGFPMLIFETPKTDSTFVIFPKVKRTWRQKGCSFLHFLV